jgi:hypothetical protein
MPRPLWKGAISFSMVTIPIKLYSATEEKDALQHAARHRPSRIKQSASAPTDIEVDNENRRAKYHRASTSCRASDSKRSPYRRHGYRHPRLCRPAEIDRSSTRRLIT